MKNYPLPFAPMFPSATARDGRARGISDGGGQGRASSKRIAHCKQCGFPNDASRVTSKGGNLNGDGGLTAVTKTTQNYTVSGISRSETYGDRNVTKYGGCAHCGSQNWLA